MKTNLKRKIVSAFMLGSFLVSGLITNTAYALPTTDIVANVYNVTQDILEQIKEVGKDVLNASISTALNQFAQDLANNIVNGVATGDWGQEPLYFNLPVEDILSNVVDTATGNVIDQLEKDLDIANLCAPLNANINYKFKLVLNILPSYKTGNNVTSASECTLSKFVNNLKVSYENIVKEVKTAVAGDCFSSFEPSFNSEKYDNINSNYSDFLFSEMDSVGLSMADKALNTSYDVLETIAQAIPNYDLFKGAYLYDVDGESIDQANASYFTKKTVYYRQKEINPACTSYDGNSEGGYLCTLAENKLANNKANCLTNNFVDFVYSLFDVNIGTGGIGLAGTVGGLVGGPAALFNTKIQEAKTYTELESAAKDTLKLIYDHSGGISVCSNDKSKTCLFDADCNLTGDGKAVCKDMTSTDFGSDAAIKVCSNDYSIFCSANSQCGNGSCINPFSTEIGGKCLSYTVAETNPSAQKEVIKKVCKSSTVTTSTTCTSNADCESGFSCQEDKQIVNGYKYDTSKRRAFQKAYNDCYLKNIKDTLAASIEIGEMDASGKASATFLTQSGSRSGSGSGAYFTDTTKQACSNVVDLFVKTVGKTYETVASKNSFPDIYTVYDPSWNVNDVKNYHFGDDYKKIITLGLIEDDNDRLLNYISKRIAILQPFEQAVYNHFTLGTSFTTIGDNQQYSYRDKKGQLMISSINTNSNDVLSWSDGILRIPVEISNGNFKKYNVEITMLADADKKIASESKAIENVRKKLIENCTDNALIAKSSYELNEQNKNRLVMEEKRLEEEKEIDLQTEVAKLGYTGGIGTKDVTEPISGEVKTPAAQVKSQLDQSLNVGSDMIQQTDDPVVGAVMLFLTTLLKEGSNTLLTGLFGRVFKAVDEDIKDYGSLDTNIDPDLGDGANDGIEDPDGGTSGGTSITCGTLKKGEACQSNNDCESCQCDFTVSGGSYSVCK